MECWLVGYQAITVTQTFHFLVFSGQEDAVEGGGGAENSDVRTVPTLGHQPVVLGGLYSAVEDEFLPGKLI